MLAALDVHCDFYFYGGKHPTRSFLPPLPGVHPSVAAEIWDVVVNTLVPLTPPSINGTLPSGSTSTRYTASLSIVDGLAPFTVTIDGSLPTNVRWALNGRTIAFTTQNNRLPSFGSYPINITVTDARTETDQINYGWAFFNISIGAASATATVSGGFRFAPRVAACVVKCMLTASCYSAV